MLDALATIVVRMADRGVQLPAECPRSRANDVDSWPQLDRQPTHHFCSVAKLDIGCRTLRQSRARRRVDVAGYRSSMKSRRLE